MIFREAKVEDIKQIQVVRNSVKENMLSHPSLVSDRECEEYMTIRGKAWICHVANQIPGFAYADMKEHNVWALVVLPQFAGKGIGKQLHKIMMDWYFSQSKITIWLGTSPGTRAETFYLKQGWKPSGLHGKETKFEMNYETWQRVKTNAMTQD